MFLGDPMPLPVVHDCGTPAIPNFDLGEYGQGETTFWCHACDMWVATSREQIPGIDYNPEQLDCAGSWYVDQVMDVTLS